MFGRRRSGGRLGGRLVIALILAGIGLFMYYSQSEINPVTGEKQYVALSTDEEIALGLNAAPEMAAQMGGVLDPDHPQSRKVKEVGRRVWQNSDAIKSPYQYDFHLLADSQTINAFALPGGQIFITRGLLNQMENEAQLAGVLGHEIGHVLNRHAAEHMATGRLGQLLAAAAGVAASEDAGTGGHIMAQMVNQMIQLRYSRGDEIESDEYGLRYMAQAGYDPSAMLDVMKILAEASGGRGGPDFLATHPHPDARFENIKKFLATHYPDGVPAQLTTGRPLDSNFEVDYR